MKRILLTTVSLGVLALGMPALAADLAVNAPPVAPPTYDWSGLYIGGFRGYVFGNHNLNNALGSAGFATSRRTGSHMARLTAARSATTGRATACSSASKPTAPRPTSTAATILRSPTALAMA